MESYERGGLRVTARIDHTSWNSHISRHSGARITRPRMLATVLLCAIAYVAMLAMANVSSASPRAVPASQVHTLAVNTNQKNPSIEMTISEHLIVTLESTYWSFRALVGNVVRSVGATHTTRSTTCSPIPGSGCGQVLATFVALHRGITTIRATRTSCGEALRCSPANSRWQVVVHVH
jgi:hypothetical protein